MSFSQDWNTRQALEEYPPLNLATFGSHNFLNSVAVTWRLWLKPSSYRSFWSTRLSIRPNLWEGTWDALKGLVLSSWGSTGLGIGVEVAILANWTCLWGVCGTSSSASARISSNASLLTVDGLPRSGTWPALEEAPSQYYCMR